MRAIWLLGLAFVPLGAIWAQTGAQKGAKTPDGFAPLAYFDAHCARCHGPNGSFYGAEFGKNLKDDAALQQIVQEMCEGPGQAPLEAAKLEVLTDFHRALRDDLPFLVIVSRSKTEIKGEASPDATIVLEANGKSLAAEQKGNEWKVVLPANFEEKGAKIVARRRGKSEEITIGT